MHTQGGTLSYMAPEIWGYICRDDAKPTACLAYTNAVDIWAAGIISIQLLTGRVIFNKTQDLRQYVTGKFAIPNSLFDENSIGEEARDFARRTIAPKPEDRPSATNCLEYPWLQKGTFKADNATPNTFESSKLLGAIYQAQTQTPRLPEQKLTVSGKPPSENRNRASLNPNDIIASSRNWITPLSATVAYRYRSVSWEDMRHRRHEADVAVAHFRPSYCLHDNGFHAPHDAEK